MILKILTLLILLTLGFVIFIATRPDDFHYQRSLKIAASAETLFEQINDLKKFQSWNPWADIDPETQIIYSGPATGVGASYDWKGNAEVGEGRMTIVESIPAQRVRAKMEFIKPFAATHLAEFTFRPEGNQTLVTWSFTGKNGFLGKAIGLVMNCEKMCGDQFSKGLSKLKTLTESQSSNPLP